MLSWSYFVLQYTIYLLTNEPSSSKITIEKGAADRRLAPEAISYEKVTACFERTGRLLFRIYKLNNQSDNNADQRYQDTQYRNDKSNDLISRHAQTLRCTNFRRNGDLCQQRAFNLPLNKRANRLPLWQHPVYRDTPGVFYRILGKKARKTNFSTSRYNNRSCSSRRRNLPPRRSGLRRESARSRTG